MIADVRFSRRDGGARRLAFVPRAPLPMADACATARAIEAALRDALGACGLALGEPAVPAPGAWAALVRDAVVYVRRGAPDAVLLIPRDDARRLVLHALGECADAARAAAGDEWSPLERRALDALAARCSVALQPLCGAGAFVRAAAAETPSCAAYVDVRVLDPVRCTLGIATVRPVPERPPARTLGAEPLADVALEARAVFAEGTLDAADFVRLRPGHVVKLDTKVGAPACLKVAGARLAGGVAGVVASRTAFLVHDVATGAHGR